VAAGIAREFAANGAPVLIASRKAENLARVRDQIRKDGGVCEFQICDVRDPAAVDKIIAAAVRHFGRLDVIINNHGASPKSPSLELRAAQFAGCRWPAREAQVVILSRSAKDSS
jgi:NADP-dependent 3-hydroxy acid dehydrogenase YdfG